MARANKDAAPREASCEDDDMGTHVSSDFDLLTDLVEGGLVVLVDPANARTMPQGSCAAPRPHSARVGFVSPLLSARGAQPDSVPPSVVPKRPPFRFGAAEKANRRGHANAAQVEQQHDEQQWYGRQRIPGSRFFRGKIRAL